MASQTPNLGLVLPGFGEFVNDWWEPLNNDLTTIDTAVGAINTELQNAAAGTANLTARLAVSLNNDGSLKDVPAVLDAQNTFLYGYLDVGTTPFTLKQQLDNLGTEVWNAREGAATLKDALATRTGFPSQMVSGSVNGTNYPNYAGSTGANVKIDGSVTPLKMLIAGYEVRIRTLKSQTLSGAANTYFVYAVRSAAGVVVVDGSTTTEGITSSDGNSNPTLFNDPSVDFTLQDVKAGDLLTLLNSSDVGSYRVLTVAPGGNANQLQIVGNFPVGNQSAINYTITDTLAPTLTFALASAAAPANSIVVAEAAFDGTGVTSVLPRNYKLDFVGEWRSIDVSAPVLLAEQIYTHYFGTDKLELAVQVSQANDGSAPVEELSVGTISQNLSVAITNGLTLTLAALGQITPSSGTIGGAPAGSLAAALCTGAAPTTNFEALAGTITAALNGSIVAARSVAMNWDRNRIRVKGLVSGVFYTDYSGTVRQTGYLRVVARRRG